MTGGVYQTNLTGRSTSGCHTTAAQCQLHGFMYVILLDDIVFRAYMHYPALTTLQYPEFMFLQGPPRTMY